MNFKISFLLLFFTVISFCQKSVSIKEIEGIWIAEDFYNSFEKSKNIHESKDAFNRNYPVALRINSKEVLNNILYIGYSALHDHNLYAEESKYVIVEKDTLGKSGCFEINISKRDSLNYFETSEIHYFNYNRKSYLAWDKNKVTLYKSAKDDLKAETINYRRISDKFERNYQYPNPLYYYTRNRVIVGDYMLKEYKGKVLTKSFKINANGLAKGYTRFNKMLVYYSTDIYCGPPTNDEHLMFWDDVTREDSKNFHFVLKRPDSNTIFLYEMYPRRPEYGQVLEELGNPKYVLIKK